MFLFFLGAGRDILQDLLLQPDYNPLLLRLPFWPTFNFRFVMHSRKKHPEGKKASIYLFAKCPPYNKSFWPPNNCSRLLTCTTCLIGSLIKTWYKFMPGWSHSCPELVSFIWLVHWGVLCARCRSGWNGTAVNAEQVSEQAASHCLLFFCTHFPWLGWAYNGSQAAAAYAYIRTYARIQNESETSGNISLRQTDKCSIL